MVYLLYQSYRQLFITIITQQYLIFKQMVRNQIEMKMAFMKKKKLIQKDTYKFNLCMTYLYGSVMRLNFEKKQRYIS